MRIFLCVLISFYSISAFAAWSKTEDGKFGIGAEILADGNLEIKVCQFPKCRTEFKGPPQELYRMSQNYYFAKAIWTGILSTGTSFIPVPIGALVGSGQLINTLEILASVTSKVNDGINIYQATNSASEPVSNLIKLALAKQDSVSKKTDLEKYVRELNYYSRHAYENRKQYQISEPCHRYSGFNLCASVITQRTETKTIPQSSSGRPADSIFPPQ